MITLDKPLHLHDCDPGHCTFLGNHEGRDLYAYTEMNGSPGYIARYSSEGPGYLSSGAEWVVGTPVLEEARRRHLANGIAWTDDEGVYRMERPMVPHEERVHQAAELDCEMDPQDVWSTAVVLDSVTLIIDRHTGVTCARINYR